MEAEELTVKRTFFAILLGLVLNACAPQSDDLVPYPDPLSASTPASNMAQPLDSEVDIECFENVVASNWHDDPEMDPSTVIEAAWNDVTEMNQTTIDTLIHITLLSDETCSAEDERAY